jgi:glycosyltransferase involved in cell wall biosynthesis
VSVSEAVDTEPTRTTGRRQTLLEAIRAIGTATDAPNGGPAADDPDQLVAITRVHALAAAGAVGREELAGLLSHQVGFLREHAAWALGSGPPVPAALPALVDLVSAGGFTGAVAQATLEAFAGQTPEPVRLALIRALTTERSADARTRLVETLGLVPGPSTTRILLDLVLDPQELSEVRAAAVAAVGDLADPFDDDVRAALELVGHTGGPLGAVANLAGADLAHRAQGPTEREPGAGLTVAQLFLHADIDGSLLRAGRGDTGGIATLLVHLGDALLADPGPVQRVVTVSRGRAGDDLGLDAVDRPGHHYLPVPFWGAPVSAAEAWPLRVATRRAMRRILARARVDVLHLRMADVGSWAGAEAARDLGIPVVMTLAPDPHASVAAREADGVLSRKNLGRVDEEEHLLFRMRLLRQIQQQAAQLVVFPRPALEANLKDLLGVDLELERGRITVVPEGIDPVPLDRAARDVASAAGGGPATAATAAALAELDDLLRTLPPARRGLPLAVTVGRLHPVKGMATLVEAWLGSDLTERCNLLVVGGDLDRPSSDERRQLALVDALVARGDGPGAGLLLAGHRPNATVAVWLAAARAGRTGGCDPGGVYVSASLKEEFGIAILEAMASGLVVVAPWEGGPATYVEDGVTGVLVDTRVPTALAGAVGAALDLTAAPGADGRAAVAERLVRDRFSIQTMATALTTIYADVVA